MVSGKNERNDGEGVDVSSSRDETWLCLVKGIFQKIKPHKEDAVSAVAVDVILKVFWYWKANELQSEHPNQMSSAIMGKLSAAGPREFILDIGKKDWIRHQSIIGIGAHFIRIHSPCF
jgi:hypothetical protein